MTTLTLSEIIEYFEDPEEYALDLDYEGSYIRVTRDTVYLYDWLRGKVTHHCDVQDAAELYLFRRGIKS